MTNRVKRWTPILEARRWHGDEWPEDRASLANKGGHAVAINPKYSDPDESFWEFQAIAKCVDCHADLVEALEGLMDLESRDRVMPIGPEWDKARAALAKAYGDQQ